MCVCVCMYGHADYMGPDTATCVCVCVCIYGHADYMGPDTATCVCVCVCVCVHADYTGPDTATCVFVCVCVCADYTGPDTVTCVCGLAYSSHPHMYPHQPPLLLLDSCKRFALCFDDVISSVEMINSQGIQVQVHLYAWEGGVAACDRRCGCM